MVVLSLSRKIQRFIGVYRGDSLNSMDFTIKMLLNIIFFLGMNVLIFGSLYYIWVHFGDLESITNTIIVLMAGGSGLACYFGITSNSESITKLYELLQNLADESNQY